MPSINQVWSEFQKIDINGQPEVNYRYCEPKAIVQRAIIIAPKAQVVVNTRIDIKDDGLHLLEIQPKYRRLGLRLEEGLIGKENKTVDIIINNISNRKIVIQPKTRIAKAENKMAGHSSYIPVLETRRTLMSTKNEKWPNGVD